jgi:aminoglycoside phosphotransferase (APT) family kinase protein
MTNEPFEGDLDRLASAFERRFPDLRPVRPLTVLGRGFRSVALETPGGVVLRVGQSRDASDDYAKEWRMGRFLAEHMRALVPAPRWYVEPCDDFPYGALGYKKLPGETPVWGVDPGPAFASDLGAFMARLHGLPVDEARVAGVPEVDSYRRLLGARDVIMPVLSVRLAPAEVARIEAWWAAFAADERMRTARFAVCHHDLWHDNLLRSSSGRLSGVLDIAHVEVGDPAHDFPAPRYFGEAFMLELIFAYRNAGGTFDAGGEYRAKRFHEGREFGGLAWAVEHDDAAETDAAIEKIVRGPLFGDQ